MYLRDIIVFCNHALPYAKNLEDDTAIKNYRIMMCSVCKFIEQIVVEDIVRTLCPVIYLHFKSLRRKNT